MILEQNVTLIVTTTKLVENEKVKLHKFWPEEILKGRSDKKIVSSLKVMGINLRLIEEVELAPELNLRTFELTNPRLQGYGDRKVV